MENLSAAVIAARTTSSDGCVASGMAEMVSISHRDQLASPLGSAIGWFDSRRPSSSAWITGALLSTSSPHVLRAKWTASSTRVASA